MNSKWMKLGLVAVVVLALGVGVVVVSAQGWGNPGGRMGWSEESLLAVAAEALGMEQADLVTELQAGKTIADLAEEKGVALDTIVEAYTATYTESLASAVTAGTLTQAQADALLEAAKVQATLHLSQAYVGRGFGMDMMGRSFGMGMMGGTSFLATAAEALGIEQADLVTELQAGKTIADLAEEKGVALDTIVDALLAQHTTALTNAITAGTLTQEQADLMLANMESHLTLSLSQAYGDFGYGMSGMMGRSMGGGMMGRGGMGHGMGSGMMGRGGMGGMWFFDNSVPTTPQTSSNGA